MEPPGDHPPPRLLLPSNRADVRATWHRSRDALVVSLWHDRVCAASAPLTIEDTARLAGFLVDHLAARAIEAERDASDATVPLDDEEPAAGTGPGDAGAATGDAATVPDHDATVALPGVGARHLRVAPGPGPGQRAGANLDQTIAAGGAALSAAVDAARRTWRSHRS